MQRRAFLKGTGIVTVLIGGGGVWRAWDQGVFSAGEGPAYEPWKNWRTAQSEGPLALVRAAILAANPHNTQPWLFRVSDARIDLFADTTRRIGATDPFLREMYIGVGCALENLLLAAEANGYVANLTIAPDATDPTHAARIELSKGKAVESDLYRAIPQRHTNRGPYALNRAVPPETLQVLQSLNHDQGMAVFWFTKDDERRRLSELVMQATKAIVADAEQAHDSARWYRFDWHDLQQYRDGITLDAGGGASLLRAAAKILPRQSPERNDQYWLKATREVHTATAAAYGLLAVRNADDVAQRIRCGRLWQRMHLWATTQGLAMHPLKQMPERAAREQVLHLAPTFGTALNELTGNAGWQPLLIFRLGYPTVQALPSPRRAIEAVLREAHQPTA